MRILIPLFSPPTGTWGGMTRVIAVSEAAQAAGHEIAFCANGSLAQTLRERGYQVFETPASTLFGLPPALSARMEKRSQSITIPVPPGKEVGNFWFVLGLSGLANPGYLQKLVDAELAAVAQFKPDRLFTDADPGAYLTAAITQIPVAGNFASIMQKGKGSRAYRRMENAANRVSKTHGRPAMALDSLYFGPQVLKIIPSIPELDDTPADQADALYVGSLLGAIQPAKATVAFDSRRRYVFAYLGTGSLSLEAARQVLPQVFPATGPLRCIVGAQSITRPFASEGVEFLPYVPAEALLPYCDWTLCHGGQNTIIQSLRTGVPLLIFPGPIFERRYNARKVVEANAGIMGEINQFSRQWFEAAFARHDEASVGAAQLAARIRSYPGAQAVVSALEKWKN
jgi:Glycosyl transferases, related to UDP-glucuronosyltransferase